MLEGTRARVALLAGLAAVAVPAVIVSLRDNGHDAHDMSAHHGAGVPSAIVSERAVGAYVVSVWAEPVIGDATIYVVAHMPNGATFEPPTSVRVSAAPTSGRLPEETHETHGEPVRDGMRYTANVSFDRQELWTIRLVIEGAASVGTLTTRVEAVPAASHGLPGLILSTLPFLAVGVLWWRRAADRQRLRVTSSSSR